MSVIMSDRGEGEAAVTAQSVKKGWVATVISFHAKQSPPGKETAACFSFGGGQLGDAVNELWMIAEFLACSMAFYL